MADNLGVPVCIMNLQKWVDSVEVRCRSWTVEEQTERDTEAGREGETRAEPTTRQLPEADARPAVVGDLQEVIYIPPSWLGTR